jgi:hypothetical protein
MQTLSLAAACILSIALAFGCANVVEPIDMPVRFRLQGIARWFDTLRANGIDLSKPVIFGYDFNSANFSEINALRARLAVDGYSFVQTYVDNEGRTWLEVEKKEVHSPESLFERNRQLRSLANEFRTVQYDGYAINQYSSR